MRELILSDITLMGQGYCVIGLESEARGAYRSVRPLPRNSYAWPTFPYGRGTLVRFSPAATVAPPPHREDQKTLGLAPTNETVSELDLVARLQVAEVSATLEGLFGRELHTDTPGGNAWADPRVATRSICGCEFKNIRFRVFEERGEWNLRAKLALPSGEILNSLPIVDREWRRFFSNLLRRRSESGVDFDSETVLNQSIRAELLRASYKFVRIGLARGSPNEGKCWLMLDSLFPQPNEAWLAGV